MKKSYIQAILWVLIPSALFLSGCGGGTATNDSATLTSIAVTPATPSIVIGDTQQFTATGTYSDNSIDDVTSIATWTSTNPSKATVTSAGVATGTGDGTSTIGASLDGKTNSTQLTVTTDPVAPTITSQPANKSVTVGHTATFSVTASGTSLHYQWRNGATDVGTDSSIYTTPLTALDDSGSTFRVVVSNDVGNVTSAVATLTVTAPPADVVHIAYLHHSTGENIWNGGVPGFFTTYNSVHGTDYRITSITYPNTGGGYLWANYPYDYWNLWVNHTGLNQDSGELNLDQIAADYDVIVFKHCFPVSSVIAPDNNPLISSPTQTDANYRLQYAALKARMKNDFPTKKFILWTGATWNSGSTNPQDAQRARDFFNWVKNTWDEDGDNIFIWDFYELETEGGLYILPAYDVGDSHPNATFSGTVAPYISQRIVDVIEGRGDSGSITGH